MNAVETFRSKAPKLIAQLLGDFPIHAEDGFAIAGNGGGESLGFSDLTEDNPTVKGSRGGYGWFQWTGPRRKAFEAYCARNKLDPASDEANYAWLFLELKGSEAKAISAILRADGQPAKVVAFERAFLRAGKPNYPNRLEWTRQAEKAWAESGLNAAPTPAVRQREILNDEAAARESRSVTAAGASAKAGSAGGVSTASGVGLGANDGMQLADLLLVGLGVVLAVVAGVLLLRMWREAKTARTLRAAATELGKA
jgi:hypothetical protein